MARTAPYREERLALARQMLLTDPQVTPHYINKACKAQFGGHGLSHDTVVHLRAQMQLAGDLPREAPGSKPASVTPIPVPAEMILAEPVERARGLSLPATVRDLQAWMADVQAEQVVLTSSGKCSVLAWHHFDVGG